MIYARDVHKVSGLSFPSCRACRACHLPETGKATGKAVGESLREASEGSPSSAPDVPPSELSHPSEPAELAELADRPSVCFARSSSSSKLLEIMKIFVDYGFSRKQLFSKYSNQNLESLMRPNPTAGAEEGSAGPQERLYRGGAEVVKGSNWNCFRILEIF